MRKLVEATFMTLGGVVDAPNIVEDARRYFCSDEEHERYAKKLLFSADALLLGRKTYETFAVAYPSMTNTAPGVANDFVDRMNTIPKYVASRTLKETKWNASIIRGEVAEQVFKLKQQAGHDILKYGTGQLDLVLMEHNLIDEFHIYLYPFVVGRGIRFFEDIVGTTHLKLVELTTFKNGTVVLTYSPRR